MKIGHITIVNRGVERIVEPIEKTRGDAWDEARQRQKRLREAEEKYRKQILDGAKLRLYNRKGLLITEVD